MRLHDWSVEGALFEVFVVPDLVKDGEWLAINYSAEKHIRINSFLIIINRLFSLDLI
jgi:hypothetical protein